MYVQANAKGIMATLNSTKSYFWMIICALSFNVSAEMLATPIILDFGVAIESHDFIEGVVDNILKPSNSDECPYHQIALRVKNSYKHTTDLNSLINVYTAKDSHSFSVGNSIIIGVSKNQYAVNDTTCIIKENEKQHPRDGHFLEIGYSKTLGVFSNSKSQIHFEACNTDFKFLYEDKFLEKGIKASLFNKNGKSCRVLHAPTSLYLNFLTDDITLAEKLKES